MERKLKVSEFAELIGITSKTVYKMESRGEIKTVNERVNNRLTTIVVTNDEEIQKFRLSYSKSPFNNSNYEEFVTNNNESMNNNNSSQTAPNNEFIQEIFEKIVILNEEYNNRIEKLNNELIDSKSKLLLLEDRAGKEGLYLKEINELKAENEQLKTSKSRSLNALVTVIVILLMVVVGFVTYSVSANIQKEHAQQEITQTTSNVVSNAQNTNKPVKQNNKKR
jgi:hypothetical protein